MNPNGFSHVSENAGFYVNNYKNTREFYDTFPSNHQSSHNVRENGLFGK